MAEDYNGDGSDLSEEQLAALSLKEKPKKETKKVEGGIDKTCEDCKETFQSLPEEKWKKTCLDCFKKRKEEVERDSIRKMCVMCQEAFFVKPDEAKWKENCGKCFVKYSKECNECGKRFLPKGSWQKNCASCFKSKKEAEGAGRGSRGGRGRGRGRGRGAGRGAGSDDGW